MPRLIVIDSGNICHKAIFSFRNNPQIPAVYTYTRMIVGYLKRLKATLEDIVIIAEDYGSWRKAIDPTYKAQRKAFRESKEDADWWKEVYGEFNKFIPRLDESLPFYFIKIYNCEADDIASVAVRNINNVEEKILISSDRDWEMLCQVEGVRIFSPKTKTFKEVKHPMKVLLEKIQGDVSDNLLTKPSNDMEYERRKKIVNLLELPLEIETKIKEKIMILPPKNLYIDKVPFRSVKIELAKLYLGEKK